MHPIDVRGLIQMRQRTDSVLCKVNNRLRKGHIFHDAIRAVEHRLVYQDSHLVRSQVKKNLQTMYGSRRCLRCIRSRQLQLRRQRLLPLGDLIVEVADVFFFDGRGPRGLEAGDGLPDAGAEVGVLDHGVQVWNVEFLLLVS